MNEAAFIYQQRANKGKVFQVRSACTDLTNHWKRTNSAFRDHVRPLIIYQPKHNLKTIIFLPHISSILIQFIAGGTGEMLAGNEVGLDEHDVSFALMIHVVAIDEVLDIKLKGETRLGKARRKVGDDGAGDQRAGQGDRSPEGGCCRNL